MGVIKEIFGEFTDSATGETSPVYRYKLTCKEPGIEVQLLSYGAGICGVVAPDAKGTRDHVVLGFDSMEGYLAHSYHGSTIGRVANRINNGVFMLDGTTHKLTVNNGPNSLHGGTRGWDKRLWSGCVVDDDVVFSLVTEDGDQGYPGTVMAQVRYSLTAPGQLAVDYCALSSKRTPINMTNHTFFNLAGHAAGREELVRHTATLHCDRYVPVTTNLVPTGELRPMSGSVFDLRSKTTFEEALKNVDEGGFDHCFVLSDTDRGKLRMGASFSHPSGRGLEVWTTEPGVQFYTGNFLPANDGPGLPGRGGASYTRQGAFCCEAQNLPDAVNHDNFPSSILNPGEMYRHSLVYKFTVQ